MDSLKPEIEILPFFLSARQTVWSWSQLSDVLNDMRSGWGVPDTYNVGHLIENLSQTDPKLKKVTLDFSFMPVTRYWCREPTPYEVAMTIRPRGYISHASAMHLHGLSRNPSSVIYYNVEQPNKGNPAAKLKQESIDRAFNRIPRISNNIASYDDWTICVINGKDTEDLGTITRKFPVHGTLRLTSLERTLIDIVVRPAYAGGVADILYAYQKALDCVNLHDLYNMLGRLSYIYPYHQSIGFLLERAGLLDNIALELFREPGLKYDFYLDYQMESPAYSKEWRVHYPKELDVIA